MNKKFIAGLLIGLMPLAAVHAQKNFTMEEAVLGLATNLKIEDMPQLGFQGSSPRWTRIVGSGSGQAMVSTAPGGGVDTIIRLHEIDEAVEGVNLRHMPTIQWLGRDLFYFNISNELYRGKKEGGRYTISRWRSLGENAREITIGEQGAVVTYCVDNNLMLIDQDGNTKAVTNDVSKSIVNGQSVHRNEFGISTGTFISPGENYVAFYRMDESMVADYPIIDWSRTPAVANTIKYPMAGGITHEVQVGVYEVKSGRKIFLSTPQPLKDYYLTCVTWSPDEQYIFIAVLSRDQRHMRLLQFDARHGSLVQELFREDDERYVEPQHPLYFLPGGKEFIWFSQRDGYMHLYRYDLEGKLLNPVTYGDWVVKSIEGINEKTKELIITATKDDPRETGIYAVHYITGKLRKISRTEGTHTAIVSKDGRYILDAYRNTRTPKNIDLLDIEQREATVLLEAGNPLEGYNTAQIKEVILEADDGTPLYGRLMLPHDFNPGKRYPVVYYLYNGPHVQLITNSFPASGNLWYDYLTQHGFIVFSMDGRGSANRGLDFEQAIHNQLATVEMRDHLKGVGYLKSLPYVDGDRMGIHGWSYGGFMTTSLMTRYPDVFRAGVAGGPVIDWEMYEIMYTERYMSSPATNPEGYRGNNLLNYAKDLKGKLLLIHGTDDDVVVWQHSVDFIRKCVDEKVQVDYFVYPGHPHNVRGKDRVHLMQKVTDYFVQHLQP
ncbi:MAG: S9 family peptidase [Taibaiella sp.]|nr:S9 family peptidase [Taibaiella sp.]